MIMQFIGEEHLDDENLKRSFEQIYNCKISSFKRIPSPYEINPGFVVWEAQFDGMPNPDDTPFWPDLPN